MYIIYSIHNIINIGINNICISIFVVNFAHIISETDVYTFGLGQYGQLGHGTFVFESSVPKPVKRLKRHKICNIACGENHTAVIAGMGVQNSGATSSSSLLCCESFPYMMGSSRHIHYWF